MDTGATPATFRQHEDKVLLVLTLIIGATVGLVIVAFILVTENLGSRMYPAGAAAWRRVLIPVAGALMTGYLLQRYFPNARGSGIPQTKTALFIHNGHISFRTVLGKFCCSAVSLASGISLGREGPSVQVGAGIASVLGRRLGLSRNTIKALVPIGASAALAAAFNTPIAAVLFTLEEVMGDLHAPVLGSIVLSSATSWMVLHLLLGDEPLFHVPAYQLVHPMEFLVYAMLGAAGGLVSVCFVKLLLRLRKSFLGMPHRTQWLQPAAGGLLVGLLGWFVPQVLGVGYSHVSEALNGKMSLALMALLVALKVVATAGCYASGNAGGIFGPSLFIGAMAGGTVGGAAHHLFPDYTGSPGAYALVGMGTAFAGIVRVPLASAIMIFEMTRDYSIIVPVMISNLISFFVSYKLQREPIYEALQHQDGIHLPLGGRRRETVLLAGHAMRPATEVLSADDRVADVAMRTTEPDHNAWPVVNANGLLGMITTAQLETALKESGGEKVLRDILPEPNQQASLRAENFPHVHADHALDTVLHRMAATGMNVLPVVSRTNVRELKGLVTLGDILSTYGLGKERVQISEPEPEDEHASGTILTGAIAATLGALALAGFLTYFYRTERREKAQQSFQQGNELFRQGRTEEAIERYRNALSLVHSREHRFALALALVSAGRLDEAGIYLREVLQDDPTSGPANLGLARIAAKQRKTAEAVDYYHRAIYGSWPEDPQRNRTQARFELAEFLGKIGSGKQASTELLALLDEVAADTPTKKRIGHLLLDFGSPQDAARVFRDLLRQDRRDAEAYGGLGEAEFAQEDYVAARDAFRNALRWNPRDEAASKGLQLCEHILALDPTVRDISTAERYRRSRQLVESTLRAMEQCIAENRGVAFDSVRELTARAREVLSRRRRPQSYGDAAESGISLAEDLWNTRRKLCTSLKSRDEALDRLLARLSH